jgi:hypothetical protein
MLGSGKSFSLSKISAQSSLSNHVLDKDELPYWSIDWGCDIVSNKSGLIIFSISCLKLVRMSHEAVTELMKEHASSTESPKVYDLLDLDLGISGIHRQVRNMRVSCATLSKRSHCTRHNTVMVVMAAQALIQCRRNMKNDLHLLTKA